MRVAIITKEITTCTGPVLVLQDGLRITSRNTARYRASRKRVRFTIHTVRYTITMVTASTHVPVGNIYEVVPKGKTYVVASFLIS